MIAVPVTHQARNVGPQEEKAVIGGIYCGREIAPGIWAEQLTERRFVIRQQTEPNFAKRLGEVCGGEQYRGGAEFQATRMNGDHVAMRKSLLAAAKTLIQTA